jgi:hypothetical protein
VAEPWTSLSAVRSELAPVRLINPKLKHWIIIGSPFRRKTFEDDIKSLLGWCAASQPLYRTEAIQIDHRLPGRAQDLYVI